MRLFGLLFLLSALCGISFAQAKEGGGEEVLTSLKMVEKSFFYKVSAKENNFGFSKSSIKAKNDDVTLDKEIYIKAPNGLVIDGGFSATLDKRFSPKTITLTKNMKNPKGQSQKEKVIVKIDNKNIQITSDKGGKETVKKVDLPQKKFIVGLEFLITLIDFNKFPKFTLNELNPESGELVELEFVAKKTEKALVVTATKTMDKKLYMTFTFDKEGKKLISLQEAGPPFSEQAVDEKEYNKIKSGMGK